jgi:NAD+--asparagine ADP-ribosyltransferase
LFSKQTLNHKKSRKLRKIEEIYLTKEKNKEAEEQQQPQIKKFPEPIIYDPDSNQRNILLADNRFKEDKQQTSNDAMEITNYYLQLHKNLINTSNSINSQILHNISNSSGDHFFTINGRLTNYSTFDIENMYTSLSSNRNKPLKLIDNIITENLDTFIKSIELTQKFYKNVIESYLNCIKKGEQ